MKKFALLSLIVAGSLTPAALAQAPDTPLLTAGMTQGEPPGPVHFPDAP